MDKLYEVLSRNKKLAKLSKELSLGIRIQSSWELIFNSLSKDLTYGFYRSGLLGVVAENPIWVTEIDYYKEQFIDKINTQLFNKKRVVVELKIIMDVPTIESRDENDGIDPLLSTEQKIKERVAQRYRDGYQLCAQCQNMFVKEGACVFCRSDKIGDSE